LKRKKNQFAYREHKEDKTTQAGSKGRESELSQSKAMSYGMRSNTTSHQMEKNIKHTVFDSQLFTVSFVSF